MMPSGLLKKLVTDMLRKMGNRAGQTAVGIDSRIEGDIWFVGNAVIDGYVNGRIMAGKDDNATLTINENGHVKGSVAAPHLLINGIVEGEVRATGRLALGPKARVSGAIQYNLIEISIGAQIDGELIYKNEGSIVQEDTKSEAGQIEDRLHFPDRKFLDPSSSDPDEPTGIDPYDTAKLHKK